MNSKSLMSYPIPNLDLRTRRRLLVSRLRAVHAKRMIDHTSALLILFSMLQTQKQNIHWKGKQY